MMIFILKLLSALGPDLHVHVRESQLKEGRKAVTNNTM